MKKRTGTIVNWQFILITLITLTTTLNLTNHAQAQNCQPGWVNRTFPNQIVPSPRYNHAMAYDSKRGVTVLFGGRIFNGQEMALIGDTWEYDGSSWKKVATDGPGLRERAGMTYDSKRGVVVLFGGEDDNGNLSDTWEWDGHTWKQVATTGPSPRYSPAMAYDPKRGVTTLVGGVLEATARYFRLSGEVWTWDGTKWHNIIQHGEHPRAAYSMAYDSDRDRMIVIGEIDNSNPFKNPSLPEFTWEWDGQSWTKQDAVGPLHRRDYQMVYDSTRKRTVFFGSDNRYTESDTWEYDGLNWYLVSEDGPVEMSEQIPGRKSHGMVYDTNRDRTVLFGGKSIHDGTIYFFEDTWEYTGSTGVEVFDLPANQTVIHGETAVFSVQTDHAIGPVHFQWQKGGVDLHDDGRITGATTNTLTVRDITTDDEDSYSLIVQDDCHQIDTDKAWLFVVDPQLTSTSSDCPRSGPLTVQWAFVTPNSMVALLYSSTIGSTIIPAGYPCAGTTLDLGNAGLRIAFQAMDDGGGNGFVIDTIPDQACGNYLQLIDLNTCLTSNVVQIQ